MENMSFIKNIKKPKLIGPAPKAFSRIRLLPDQGAYTYSLSQSFIKPISKVVGYNGSSLKELERERW
jgi:hypothetical protein